MSVSFVTHIERPELVELEELWRSWPTFMLHDPVADDRWGLLYERFGEFQYWGLDDESGEIVVKANAVPVALDPARLPDGGWRETVRRAIDDEVEPQLVSALQILVAEDRRGEGLSGLALGAMRRLVAAHGFSDLVAPVRPSAKADYPITPIARYVGWRRADGLPFDPWLRVHARAGAELVGVCHGSMEVAGTVGDWEEWTGMAFPETGDYVVPGALTPVTIDREADRGLYVEPNVWMHHRLG
jgi:GNAT superfamily N-acetyltransferase